MSIVLLVCATAALASATQVELQFNGTGPNSYEGTPSYPYYFTLTDGVAPENVSLMCVSFNEHIEGGETWLATQYTVAEYGNILQSEKISAPGFAVDGKTFTGSRVADGLAYLYMQAWHDGGSNSFINAAAWYLNEGAPSYNQQIGYWINKALEAQPGAYDGISVYVPVNGSQSWQGETPQTFFGGTATATPEPSSLMLLGSGMVGLAGLLRKRFLA